MVTGAVAAVELAIERWDELDPNRSRGREPAGRLLFFLPPRMLDEVVVA
jgi:hypothetical protein